MPYGLTGMHCFQYCVADANGFAIVGLVLYHLNGRVDKCIEYRVE